MKKNAKNKNKYNKHTQVHNKNKININRNKPRILFINLCFTHSLIRKKYIIKLKSFTY